VQIALAGSPTATWRSTSHRAGTSSAS